MADAPAYVTPRAAAVLVHRDKRTINRWIRAGLPTQTVRGQRYIARSDLYAWILRHAETVEPT